MPRIASSTHVPQLLAVSATLGLLATVGLASHASSQVIAEPPLPLELEDAVAPVEIAEVAVVRQPAPPPAPTSQLLFTFRVGGELYVKLSNDEPAHGKRTLIEDDDGSSTVAEVAPANLPASFRGWADKTFALDGGCTATVKGFAVVTRMVGTPSYAGLDTSTWTAKTAAEAGTAQLAARLDAPQACAKALPLYARDASLAPMLQLETLDRPELVDQARAALLATAAADEAQTAWAEHGEGAWIEHAQVQSFTRRHPTTGQVFVGIHASIQEGCGGPDVNVWGLFRVGRDGKLVTVLAQRLDTLYAVERILDVDNDGTLELLGHDWLGLSNLLTRANGEVMSQLELQFHGCPC